VIHLFSTQDHLVLLQNIKEALEALHDTCSPWEQGIAAFAESSFNHYGTISSTHSEHGHSCTSSITSNIIALYLPLTWLLHISGQKGNISGFSVCANAEFQLHLIHNNHSNF
jgi:hypothetical protein